MRSVWGRVACELRVAIVVAMGVLAVAGCSSGISNLKGMEEDGVFGLVSNAAGTCVTLSTPSPGVPESLAAGSQLSVNRAFGKVGTCVSFLAADAPVGDRSTNSYRWISGVQTADNSHCEASAVP
jgi:hypothetical protein